MQRALTDVFVRSAKPSGAGRTEISDLRCVGLVLRIAEDGGKSWSFRFRTRTGKQTRATIGRYPDVALTAARQRADAMRRAVAEGRNPVEEKRALPWRQGLPGRSGRWRNAISTSTPAAENAAARVTNEIYANTSSPMGAAAL